MSRSAGGSCVCIHAVVPTLSVRTHRVDNTGRGTDTGRAHAPAGRCAPPRPALPSRAQRRRPPLLLAPAARPKGRRHGCHCRLQRHPTRQRHAPPTARHLSLLSLLSHRHPSHGQPPMMLQARGLRPQAPPLPASLPVPPRHHCPPPRQYPLQWEKFARRPPGPAPPRRRRVRTAPTDSWIAARPMRRAGRRYEADATSAAPRAPRGLGSPQATTPPSKAWVAAALMTPPPAAWPAAAAVAAALALPAAARAPALPA